MAKKTRGARTKLKVLKKENPAWVKMGAKDIENLVVKLSSEGLGAAMIGTKLRDSYGIPNIKLATGKSVTQILKEGGAKMDLPVDLGNLLKRVSVLQKHMAENRGDLHNKRGLAMIEARIRRLAKYYQKKGTLPKTWKYSSKTVELLIK